MDKQIVKYVFHFDAIPSRALANARLVLVESLSLVASAITQSNDLSGEEGVVQRWTAWIQGAHRNHYGQDVKCGHPSDALGAILFVCGEMAHKQESNKRLEKMTLRDSVLEAMIKAFEIQTSLRNAVVEENAERSLENRALSMSAATTAVAVWLLGGSEVQAHMAVRRALLHECNAEKDEVLHCAKACQYAVQLALNAVHGEVESVHEKSWQNHKSTVSLNAELGTSHMEAVEYQQHEQQQSQVLSCNDDNDDDVGSKDGRLSGIKRRRLDTEDDHRKNIHTDSGDVRKMLSTAESNLLKCQHGQGETQKRVTELVSTLCALPQSESDAHYSIQLSNFVRNLGIFDQMHIQNETSAVQNNSSPKVIVDAILSTLLPTAEEKNRMDSALHKLRNFVSTIESKAEVRPFGSFAMGINIKGSDIDCAIVMRDKKAMREAIVQEFHADVARDDKAFMRIIADIDGVSLDMSLHKPDEMVLRQRLFGVEAFGALLRENEIHRQTITLLKHWAKRHLIYGVHLGYLNSIILVEMYFAKLREIRPGHDILKILEHFFDCYRGISFREFKNMQWKTTKKGALRIFIDRHSWCVIQEEMNESHRLLRRGDIEGCFAETDLNQLQERYEFVFVADERPKPPMIESGIKYLAHEFARDAIHQCRIVKQKGKIFVMFQDKQRSHSTTPPDPRVFDAGMERFGQSFKKYGGDKIDFERLK